MANTKKSAPKKSAKIVKPTTKKPAYKKGQNPPQSKHYSAGRDADKDAKAVGYRWTAEGAHKLGKKATTRPTAAEVEQYANKTFRIARKPNPNSDDGSYRYVYSEKRVDKSDFNRKLHLEDGGDVKLHSTDYVIVDGDSLVRLSKSNEILIYADRKEAENDCVGNQKVVSCDKLNESQTREVLSQLNDSKKEHGGDVETKKYPVLYYTVADNSGTSWDSKPQKELHDITWHDAVVACKGICKELNTTVRLCETKGYHNQGHYINHSENFAKGGTVHLKKSQNPPQSKHYSAGRDADKNAKTVGYRWTDEGAHKLGKKATTRPTATEVEQYKDKTFRIPRKPNTNSDDGSYRYIYSEKRVDKSDFNRKLHLADGGAIENGYNGRTPQDVWDNGWDNMQKQHFLSDHQYDVFGKNFSNEDKNRANKLSKEVKYKDLPADIKTAVDGHVAGGVQYKRGGAVHQASPQSKSYTQERDEWWKAKPVGWRFTDKLAQRLGVSVTTKPTAQQIEKYKGRGIYFESRVDKSDMKPSKRLEEGGDLNSGELINAPTFADGGKTKIIPNQKSDVEFTPYLACAYAEGFEESPSKEATIEAWAYLIATKQAYSLQGWFGRTAEDLIANGFIERDGTINWDAVEDAGEFKRGGAVHQASPQSQSYTSERDEWWKAKPVGYRFTDKLAGKLGLTPTKKPSAEQVEKYKGKGVYFETRVDKSDIKPASRLQDGGGIDVVDVDAPPTEGAGEFARGGGVDKITNSDMKAYTENMLPFRANHVDAKVLDNGDYLVTSYGHYPIWFWCKAENKWYGNKDKYSVTTAKQISQSRPSYDAEIIPNGELQKKMLESSERQTKMAVGGALDMIIGDATNNPQMDITAPEFQGSV